MHCCGVFFFFEKKLLRVCDLTYLQSDGTVETTSTCDEFGQFFPAERGKFSFPLDWRLNVKMFTSDKVQAIVYFWRKKQRWSDKNCVLKMRERGDMYMYDVLFAMHQLNLRNKVNKKRCLLVHWLRHTDPACFFFWYHWLFHMIWLRNKPMPWYAFCCIAFLWAGTGHFSRHICYTGPG